MKKTLLLLCAFVLFCNHDMYLKLDNYFLPPNTTASIMLFNGTFDQSDNAIDRSRMLDVSLLGNGHRSAVDTSQWYEEDGMTILEFKTGEAGTWIAGVSTRPRNIAMSAADFNDYLRHDGVLDMLEWRTNNNALEQDAVEKYSKHVKAIFQVGDEKTEDWQTPLGYPIEFIPLTNPYDLHPGHDLQVKLLWQGKPLVNQLVYVAADGAKSDAARQHEHEHGDEASHDHAHDHDQTGQTEKDHHHHAATQLRTDTSGIVNVNLNSFGIWYLRTIELSPSEEPGLTHESNWATLTFEVGQGHSHREEAHSHTEMHEDDIPGYVYWIGSIALLAGLFFWFNRKN